MIQSDPWSAVLQKMKEMVSPQTYNTWVRQLSILSISGSKIVLGLSDVTGIQVLKGRYGTALSRAISDAYGRDLEIMIVNANEPLPMDAMGRGGESSLKCGMLNTKYTFDTFVVGQSNRFAHAASLAVAELPSDAYNPLFLYGGVGLGKTHLMHAIGHYIVSDNPDTRVMYITSETFTNEVIEAIKNNRQQQMRERLRNVDVLMIDDIQFIAGKTSTQEEFFHTFNHLHSSGRQIVISSDRPPKDIPTLEERLRSRFEWGLIADIQKPDYETRVAILRKRAGTEHMEVPDDVLNFIAEKVESNIRELEGSLTRVSAQATMEQRPITLDLTQQALSNLMGVRDARRITPDLIMQVVADYYHVEKNDLMSQRRNREISVPRQVAMFLTRELTNLSTTRIGDAFGGRDHTTVMHGCSKIASASRSTAQMASVLDELRSSVREK